MPVEIDCQLPMFERGGGHRSRVASPQKCVDSHHQLSGAERLGQVVIRALHQSADTIVNSATCGHHQDRHVLTGVAELSRHHKPVDAGQHHIKDD